MEIVGRIDAERSAGGSELVGKSGKSQVPRCLSPCHRSYGMVMIWLIRGLLLSLIQSESVESVDWVDGVIQGVVKNWQFQQVVIVEQFSRNESLLNPQIDNLRLRLMQNVVTIACKIEDPTKPRESLLDGCWNENSRYNTSATLYVIVSDVWRYAPLKLTIETTAALSEWMSKKILLLLTSTKPREKLEKLLKFVWAQKLLDFTIIELVEPRTKGGSLDSESRTIIHRYNPFKREYTRKNWTRREIYFEREALNMWGYPLRVAVLHEPPMSFVKFDESGQRLVSLKGANIKMVKLMAERLNFTLVWIPFQHFPEIIQDPTPSGLLQLMKSDKIDLLASMSPHHMDSKEYRIQRTSHVFVDRMCPVVPITRNVEMFTIVDACWLYLMLLIILMGLWIPTYLLKFNRRNWKLHNIFRLFLGFSWATVPKKNAERIMFACILLLSVLYFSSIFAASAQARLSYDKIASISSFEELDNSGLTPLISSFLYNKTFAYSEGFLPNLKKKSIPVGNINDCPFHAAEYKNVTCIMSERDMLITMQVNEDYQRRLKIVGPCFWSDTFGFLLGKSCPYTSHLNTVIYLAHTSGLVAKWYTKLDDIEPEDRWPRDLGEDDSSQIDHNNFNPNLLRKLITIMVLGVVASLLAFIGEIIVHKNM